MSWEKREVEKKRLEAALRLDAGESPTVVARELGRSREFVYKWHDRWRSEGSSGLLERSRAPRRSTRLDPRIEGRIVELRETHPRWGPKKLRVLLMEELGDETPSRSAVAKVLKRNGLVRPRRRRRTHAPLYDGRLTQPEAPNDVWSVDFKGQFKLRSGAYCYPLTVMDNYSRQLLGCFALRGPLMKPTRQHMDALFRRHGLPRVIRSDNGSPFASVKSMHALTKLSAGWLAQGIRHERTKPGSPQENGRHERMHRTLKAAACVPSETSFSAQQERFDAFCRMYNEVRPHEALGQRPPASVYRPSPRPFQERPAPDYPAHFEVRKVYPHGCVTFQHQLTLVGRALGGQHVAFEPLDGRLWALHFHQYVLAEFDEATRSFSPLGEDRSAFVRVRGL